MWNSSPDGQDRFFTSSDVCQMARISLRQLQWWHTHSVTVARRGSQQGQYEAGEAIEVMVIAELRRKGFSLQRIRPFARSMRREIGRRLEEALDHTSELLVLTDGKTVNLERDPERIITLLKKSREPMFLVSLSDQARRLEDFHKRPAARNRARGADDQLTLF